jgi:hypothetical protein
MTITKEKFADYEKVRVTGRTNMWDTKTVEILADNLTQNDIIDILKNYSKYNKKWPSVRCKLERLGV